MIGNSHPSFTEAVMSDEVAAQRWADPTKAGVVAAGMLIKCEERNSRHTPGSG